MVYFIDLVDVLVIRYRQNAVESQCIVPQWKCVPTVGMFCFADKILGRQDENKVEVAKLF